MKYDFDTVIDRRHTACYKYDAMKSAYKNAGDRSIPMYVADMDFKTAPCVLEAFEKLVNHGIFGYTSDKAEPEYAKAVCNWWKTRFNCDFTEDSVIYSDGAVSAVKTAVRAFTEKGDGVIIQRPVYGHFTFSIEEECGRVAVDNHLKCENGYYTMDYDDLEKKCADKRNKLMILCSPANPVGRVWSAEELKKVCDITKKYGVTLVSDEVHCDIVRKGIKHTPILNVSRDTIMITAVNKTFNLAGLQCANAVIPDKALRDRFNTGWDGASPTPFAVAALIAAYNEGHEWVDSLNEYLDENLRIAVEYFKENLPWVKVRVPEGTYCLWLDFSDCGVSAGEIHDMIYDGAGVILQDGTVHDPENGSFFQRMCVPCPRTVLSEALERIGESLKYSGK